MAPELTTNRKSLRILLIHRYFWPDTPPYASLMREIGDYWSQQGHRVSVFSTQPSYKIEVENERRLTREPLGALEVVRCDLFRERSRSLFVRGVNSLLFGWKIFWYLLRHGGNYDLVMCSTVPPVITGWMTSLGCQLRGCRFVYHAMDIWPEVAAISGQIRRGLLYRLLRWMDTRNCLAASGIVCLSEDMRRTFLARSEKLDRTLHTINNFELPEYETTTPAQPDLAKPAGKFRVLFAGNLGRYQMLDTVVRAAGRIGGGHIEFVFLGDGAAKQSLIALANRTGVLDRNVFFVSHQPAQVAKQMMRSADLCLVTLAPGVSSVAFPSKTLTLLAMGCPLAVMTELSSELANSVRDHNLGFAVGCGDDQAMADEILKLAADPHRLADVRKSVGVYAAENATAAAVLPKWNRLLDSIFEPGKVMAQTAPANSAVSGEVAK